MELTKRERKLLMEGIRLFVASKLKKLRDEKIYTYTEVSEITGISRARLSEIRGKRRYLSERTLILLICGGMIKISDIEKAATTEGHKKWINKLAIACDRKVNKKRCSYENDLEKYKRVKSEINMYLNFLNDEVRRANSLMEHFLYPAHDKTLRDSIKNGYDVRTWRSYGRYVSSVYFELVMTLMRIYDLSNSDNNICFEKLFTYLTSDVVKTLEYEEQTEINNELLRAQGRYITIKGNHKMDRLKHFRHKRFAHNAADEANRLPEYKDAEDILKATLKILNNLNSSIGNGIIDYDSQKQSFRDDVIKFWEPFIAEKEFEIKSQ